MTTTRQAARYVVVGGLAFLVDFGITWLCLQYFPLLLANTFGFLVANVFNFLAAHQWVFGRAFTRHALLADYTAVLAVSLVGLAINDAVVWLVVGLMALPLLAGKVLATLIGLCWNFAARKLWIYRTEHQ